MDKTVTRKKFQLQRDLDMYMIAQPSDILQQVCQLWGLIKCERSARITGMKQNMNFART